MAKTMFDLLEGALGELGKDQFRRFTSKLTDPGQKLRVPKSAVEDKDRGDIARLMIEQFTETCALETTLQILRNMNANQTAEYLEKEATANGFSTSARSGGSTGTATPNPNPDLIHRVPQPQPNSPKDPEAPPPEVPPTSPPNPNSALIHCSPQFKEKLLKEKGNEIYSVLDKGARKRLALLINNVEFDSENMRRNGAQRDEENMEKLLRALDYHVIKHTNLSGKEMDEAIRSFAGRREHAESDSTFVVIMSHGKRDKILGVHHGPDNTDDFLPVDNIFTHLNTENCPALLNKPKVILIQACRGDKHGRVRVSACESDDLESDGVYEHKEKDFAMLLSCTPDTVSFRNVKSGAYFIGFLVEVFNDNAHKEHIEELFRQVMRRFESYPGFKQMVSKDRISLPKLFYLFPGL